MRSWFFTVLVGALLAPVLAGCALSWQPAVSDAREDQPTLESIELLRQAEQTFNRAETRDSLVAAIEAYRRVLDRNSGDYQALVMLSTQQILLGTAHTRGRGEKSRTFRSAMRDAELAMYTNQDFKALVEQGETLWEAARVLDSAEVEAMFFWVTALQYEFKEGMSLAGKIRNIRWLQHALLVLNRIEEVAPDFGEGAVEFAKVICLYALPASFGGDKDLGDDYMRKAVARGEDRLLPRWARGKYYYPIVGDQEKSRDDLAWVAAQDPVDFTDPYPWRVYFLDDAGLLLD